ncbi:MAG: hypothetical protein HFG39_07960 [Lachnospiraceae bacterium]|nr:hypothetical protein [Lachnospiraceae bacterium]
MKSMLRQYTYYPLTITKEGRMSIAFIIGLVAGTFFFNMWGKNYMDELLLYKGLLTGRYKAGALAGVGLCLYILKKRGRRYLVLLFMELTEFCIAGRMLFSVYYGFCTGVCLSSFVYQYGFLGMAYFLLFLFPHYIAYIIMWRILNQPKRFKNAGRRILLSTLVFVLGIILEGYIHAGILQKILQVM